MDFPVAFESPQLTEGTVTLGAHVGLEPRVGASVNTEVPSVAESSHTAHSGKASPGCGSSCERTAWSPG